MFKNFESHKVNRDDDLFIRWKIEQGNLLTRHMKNHDI